MVQAKQFGEIFKITKYLKLGKWELLEKVDLLQKIMQRFFRNSVFFKNTF
jgi:hypothetical protein